MTESNRILVMGVGNPLMCDEGIGVRVVEQMLSGFVFPENVEVIDAGTMGFTIIDLLRETDRLLVIDAVDGSGYPAGTVMVLDPEEAAPNAVMHSLHDVRLVDVLQAASLLDLEPEAKVVGVQIESMQQWVLELTEPCEKALPIAMAAALDVLDGWGVSPEPRTDSELHAQIIESLRTYNPMPDTSPRSGTDDAE